MDDSDLETLLARVASGDLAAALAYLSLFVAAMLALQYAVGVASSRLFAWRG